MTDTGNPDYAAGMSGAEFRAMPAVNCHCLLRLLRDRTCASGIWSEDWDACLEDTLIKADLEIEKVNTQPPTKDK